MTDPESERHHAIALFRYGVVADLVRVPPAPRDCMRASRTKRAPRTPSPAPPARASRLRPSATGSSATAKAASMH